MWVTFWEGSLWTNAQILGMMLSAQLYDGAGVVVAVAAT